MVGIPSTIRAIGMIDTIDAIGNYHVIRLSYITTRIAGEALLVVGGQGCGHAHHRLLDLGVSAIMSDAVCRVVSPMMSRYGDEIVRASTCVRARNTSLPLRTCYPLPKLVAMLHHATAEVAAEVAAVAAAVAAALREDQDAAADYCRLGRAVKILTVQPNSGRWR